MTERNYHEQLIFLFAFQAVIEAPSLGSLLNHTNSERLMQKSLKYGALDFLAFDGGRDTKITLDNLFATENATTSSSSGSRQP